MEKLDQFPSSTRSTSTGEFSFSLGLASVSIPVPAYSFINHVFMIQPYDVAFPLLWRVTDGETVIAFLSWYAFPPLLPHTIKKDLHLSQNEIANSNIIALTAT